MSSAFPGTDWNARARGLGATLARPISTRAEENAIHYANGRYYGEDILVREVFPVELTEAERLVTLTAAPDEADAKDNVGGGYDKGLGYNARLMAHAGWWELVD